MRIRYGEKLSPEAAKQTAEELYRKLDYSLARGLQ
jgi:hypothetical protein